ncbi:MAG: restriction endonuclease subunit S [Rhodocyclaceae bacterium]|nr:restriction endonuclease subunit S [Rhodocyclaceae bacterium]
MPESQWSRRRLSDIAEIGSGGAIDSSMMGGAFALLGANGPIGTAQVTNFGPGYLVGRVGAAGAVNEVTGRCWASDNTLTVVARPAHADPRFLGHLLRFMRPEELATKNAQPLITQTNLAALVASVPADLPEQRQIATILDTLDTTIRQTEEMIEKLKQVKQGLLHDLLTRGIDANGELRPPQSQAPHLYKHSALGWIPREWTLQEFSELCESSAFGPRFPGDAYDASGPLATLRTTDMDDEGNIELSTMPRAAINPQAFAAHLLRPGDLVISRSGTCGVSGVFNGHTIDVVPGAFLIRFRLSDRRHAQFFRRYFNSVIGRPRLSRLAVGGVQKNIKGSDVLRLLVAVPSPDEAVACQRVIDAHEEDDRGYRAEARKLNALRSGLMDDLLTGRVRVTPLLA